MRYHQIADILSFKMLYYLLGIADLLEFMHNCYIHGQGIFRPQFHTAQQVLCMKMCEYIELVLEAHISLNVDTFTP